MSKTSTKYTYLMEGTGTYPNLAWAKLADIVDFSDLHGDPNMLDTTDLSCGAQTQTDGVRTAAPRSSERTGRARHGTRRWRLKPVQKCTSPCGSVAT